MSFLGCSFPRHKNNLFVPVGEDKCWRAAEHLASGLPIHSSWAGQISHREYLSDWKSIHTQIGVWKNDPREVQSQLRCLGGKRQSAVWSGHSEPSETSSLTQLAVEQGWTFNCNSFDFRESAHLFSIRHLLNFLNGLSPTEPNLQEWQIQVQVWDYATLRQMFLRHRMHQRQLHWKRVEFSLVPVFIHPAALCVFLSFIFVFCCLTSVQTVWDRGSWGSSWRFEIHITAPLKPVRWSDSRGSANSLCAGEICFSVHDYLCILFPLSLIVSILIKSRGVRTWENLSAEQGWLWFELVY